MERGGERSGLRTLNSVAAANPSSPLLTGGPLTLGQGRGTCGGATGFMFKPAKNFESDVLRGTEIDLNSTQIKALQNSRQRLR